MPTVKMDFTMKVRSDASSRALSSFRFVIPIDSETILIVSLVATIELFSITEELVVLVLIELEEFLTGVFPFVLFIPFELFRFILIAFTPLSQSL